MRWNPAQVLVSSLLGGPLAGFMLLALQARVSADGRCAGTNARGHLTIGAVAQVLLVLAGVYAPEGFPRGGLAAAGVVVPWSLARQVSAPHAGGGGAPLGWARVLVLGLACGVATILAGASLSVLSAIVAHARG